MYRPNGNSHYIPTYPCRRDLLPGYRETRKPKQQEIEAPTVTDEKIIERRRSRQYHKRWPI